MANEHREGIYKRLNQKTTDELVEIWRRNDRIEWTEIAFDVIREILLERLEDLPTQNTPIYKHVQESEEDRLAIVEEKLSDSENIPVFYEPKQVLWLNKWMNRAAIATIIIIAIQSLLQLRTFQRLVISFSLYDPDFVSWSWVIAFVIVVLGIIFEGIVFYFPLKALGYILRILMDMEFKSRGVK